MLLRTHMSTAFAVAVVLDSYLCSRIAGYSDYYLARVFLVSTSIILQYMVDAVGHRWKSFGWRRVPVRNVVHSLPVLLLFSVAIGVAPAYMLGSHLLLAVPVSAALLHWAEDLVTEGGVYVFRRRLRLPLRISYDNPLVNRATVVAFAVIMFMFAKPFDSIFNFVIFSAATLALAYAFLTT